MRAAAIFAFAIASLPLGAATFGAAAAYPHLHPKHVALECRDCHALKPNETEIHDMPGHATCAGCHNFALEAVNRTEGFCGECHTSTNATTADPDLFAFPRAHANADFGDLFSHVAHKNAGAATRCDSPGRAVQSQCADCHKPLATQTAAMHPDKQSEASHAFCFICHCETPVNYSAARKTENPSRNDCAVCHVGREPQLVSFADVRGFSHADHLFDTRPRLKKAGPVDRNPDRLCVECHNSAAGAGHLAEIREPAAATCRSCHDGKPGLPDVLPADVLAGLETRP